MELAPEYKVKILPGLIYFYFELLIIYKYSLFVNFVVWMMLQLFIYMLYALYTKYVDK